MGKVCVDDVKSPNRIEAPIVRSAALTLGRQCYYLKCHQQIWYEIEVFELRTKRQRRGKVAILDHDRPELKLIEIIHVLNLHFLKALDLPSVLPVWVPLSHLNL